MTLRYPATHITQCLRYCARCRKYREVTKGCKMPGTRGRSVGRGLFVCAECASK